MEVTLAAVKRGNCFSNGPLRDDCAYTEDRGNAKTGARVATQAIAGISEDDIESVLLYINLLNNLRNVPSFAK
jgi:hypothetical protein